ncbi:MAG TPA: hypothetical protein VLH13_04875 [Methanomassiliicoccales archaeon]|nr:hypothetical protein [Methanomassiliicoccales archaeon]
MASIGAALAILGSILVGLWFVGQAQLNGLVPSSLALWSMRSLVDFISNLVFWEALFIGIPAILGVIAAYMWYMRLPRDEREEYKRGHLFGSRSKSKNGSDWFSFLIFIAFAIKVSLDNNWDLAFSAWSFDYLVYSWVVALISVLVVLGIPALVGGIWWLRREAMRSND